VPDEDVLTASISKASDCTYADSLDVCITNLAGSVIAERSFPLAADCAQLERMIAELRPHCQSFEFLSDAGTLVIWKKSLMDYSTLTIRSKKFDETRRPEYQTEQARRRAAESELPCQNARSSGWGQSGYDDAW